MSNEEAFVNELIEYIFDYPDEDYMLMESICRKLYKHGLIDKKDRVWTTVMRENDFCSYGEKKQ